MRVELSAGVKKYDFRGQSNVQRPCAVQFRGLNPEGLMDAAKPENATNLIKLLTKQLELFNNVSIKKKFGNYEVPIHNSAITPYMNESYSYASFKKLYRQVNADGVFKFNVNEANGFVKTSDIVPKTYEEKKMANSVWITDTCRNMSLLKKEHPELCTKALESLSTFYKKQQSKFDEIIENPDKFKYNSGWQDGGVSHVFSPETYEPNTDFPKTRLESIGQYMQRASELIIGGVEKGKISGYKNSAEISDNTIDSIANCTKYLKAVHYPNAHSCGSWEETTFYNSLTSDTSIINEGFRKIMDLMYKKTDNPELLKVRERILTSKHGDVFANKDELTNLLKDGEERLIVNHSWEAYGERKLDAALSFVTHYEKGSLVHYNTNLTPSQNVIADINENVNLLKSLENSPESRGLVGENGIARYLNDKYKNLNFDLPKLEGKFEGNHEAQWFMVSDISKGYGVQLKKLLNVIKKEQRLPNDEEKVLLDSLLRKETEYINRTYARITGKNLTKANGEPCPANKLSEAFQAVTDELGNVETKPGTNTPLAWAQSSALDATKVYLQNLKELETMSYKTNILSTSNSFSRVV